ALHDRPPAPRPGLGARHGGAAAGRRGRRAARAAAARLRLSRGRRGSSRPRGERRSLASLRRTAPSGRRPAARSGEQDGEDPAHEDAVEGPRAVDRRDRRAQPPDAAEVQQVGTDQRPQAAGHVGQPGAEPRDIARAAVAATSGGTKVGTAMPTPRTGWAMAWTTAATTPMPARLGTQSPFFTTR